MPPEAKDVPALMAALIDWLEAEQELSIPLKAAIAHYQYATIHPYRDGNGRTAHLLTTLILHLGGYGLHGLYALEEYYARDLKAYYLALTIGPSHNYYLGRAEADITSWIAYFVAGMTASFENVQAQALREDQARGAIGIARSLRLLYARQRKALALFVHSQQVTSREIAELFGFGQRAASALCQRWVAEGFLVIANASKKARRYRLADVYEDAVGSGRVP